MRRDLAVCLFLVVATLAVYGQVARHDFVNFDDDVYVYENPRVRAGLTWDGVAWAFTTMWKSNWHPLTWLSHMLDCQFFGLNAGFHHLVNVLLHILNSVLLYLLLKRMTDAPWRSAMVAVLFALHPLHVESVAWISERKDVLSTLFFLLTLWAYTQYAAHPSVPRYGLVFGCLALGLMAKPMLVTVPFVLLLLDYWPLERLREGNHGSGVSRLIVEKVPFFVLVAASSVVTFVAQQRGEAMRSMAAIPIGSRIENALVSYIAYIGKMLWPARLAIPYPYRDTVPAIQWVGAAVALAGITAFVIWAGWRRRYLATGWLWYLGTLVPVIGLVQVGEQSMADRYTYVPLIGLFVVICWSLPDLMGRWHSRQKTLAFLAIICTITLIAMTLHQVSIWKTGITFWEHTLRVTKSNAVAHNNLGNVLKKQGRMDEAIAHYQKALLINPKHTNAHLNLGAALHEKGKSDQALQHYKIAVEIDPKCSKAYNNWGVLVMEQGQNDMAISLYRKALENDPWNAEAYSNLGVALAAKGQLDESIDYCQKGVSINPDDAVLHNNLGFVLFRQGKGDLAIAHYREAVRLNPRYSKAHLNLGFLLARQGELEQAIIHFRKALAVDSGYAEAYKNLAMALAEEGKHEEAIEYYREAIRLNPDEPSSYNNLAWIRATHPDLRYRNGAEAVELAERACELFGKKDVNLLDTLAAAYAEAGRFPEAVATVEEAISLAGSVGPRGLVPELERRLQGYRAGRPYREDERPAEVGER